MWLEDWLWCSISYIAYSNGSYKELKWLKFRKINLQRITWGEATSPWEPDMLGRFSDTKVFIWCYILVIICMLLWKRIGAISLLKEMAASIKMLVLTWNGCKEYRRFTFATSVLFETSRNIWKWHLWISQWLIVSSTITGKVKKGGGGELVS